MLSVFKAEFLKLKRNKIFFAVFLLPFFSVGVQFSIFFYKQQVSGNEILWSEYLMWNHAFLPFFIYIFLSIFYYIIVGNEYSHRTWRVLFTTPVEKKHVFLMKWFLGNLLTFVSLIIGSLLILLSAGILDISNISIIDLIYFPLFIWIGSQAMIAILCTLAIVISNGILIIGLGIVASFLYLQENDQKYLPYSYPAWVISENGYEFSYLFPFAFLSLIVAAFAIFIGLQFIKRKEF